MALSAPRALVAVHVTPRAGRDEISGMRGDELAVRVTTAPDEGKANKAVCRVLAELFGVPKSAVSVTRGATSRHKMVQVQGIGADAAAALIRERFGTEG